MARIAVLAVAAPEIELAISAAGHRVVARAAARTEAAIRAQLVTWISDPAVDAVIVVGGLADAAAPRALAPLITEPLAATSEHLRWLAFQEVGSAAMSLPAQAGRCGATAVFVLPTAPAALAEALGRAVFPVLVATPHQVTTGTIATVGDLPPPQHAVELFDIRRGGRRGLWAVGAAVTALVAGLGVFAANVVERNERVALHHRTASADPGDEGTGNRTDAIDEATRTASNADASTRTASSAGASNRGDASTRTASSADASTRTASNADASNRTAAGAAASNRGDAATRTVPGTASNRNVPGTASNRNAPTRTAPGTANRSVPTRTAAGEAADEAAEAAPEPCDEATCALHGNERECCAPFRSHATTVALERADIAAAIAAIKPAIAACAAPRRARVRCASRSPSCPMVGSAARWSRRRPRPRSASAS